MLLLLLLLLLLLTGGRLACWRLTGRLLLLLLLRLVFLCCSLTNNGGTARLRDQNRENQRRNHERNSRDCCGLAEHRAGAASAESGLSSTAAESARKIRTFTLLQKHDQNQKDANNNVNKRQ